MWSACMHAPPEGLLHGGLNWVYSSDLRLPTDISIQTKTLKYETDKDALYHLLFYFPGCLVSRQLKHISLISLHSRFNLRQNNAFILLCQSPIPFNDLLSDRTPYSKCGLDCSRRGVHIQWLLICGYDVETPE